MIEDKDETGEVAAAPSPANDMAELPDEGVETTPDERLAAAEAELAETKDRLLRALAETENVRRRFQREREDTLKYAVAGFAKDLLSPVDNLRRALESLPESEIDDARAKSLLEGVAATERELLGALERHGLRRIDPQDEPFDHNFHQAIFEVERDDAPPGTIVEVLQPGYVLHDRLLRPAMVGVAKAPQLDQHGLDQQFNLAMQGKAGSNVSAHIDPDEVKRLHIDPDEYEQKPGGIWERVPELGEPSS